MIVLNLVLIGLVITLEPLPLTAFILILSSKGGVRKGAAFIFGWLLSLAIVIAFTVLVTGNKPPKPSTPPSLAALAAKLAIGVGLTVIAIRQYKKMGKPKQPWAYQQGNSPQEHSSHESSHGWWLSGVLTPSDLEPVSGFEPLTCRLQDGCSAC
jgi:hypothetical protein